MNSTYLILIPFVSCVLYCFLLAILLGSSKNKLTRAYIYNVIAMIIWSFGSFVMKTNFSPGPLFWNRVLVLGLVCIPITFYHFTLVLTGVTNQKYRLYFGYISVIILLVFNFTGLIMSEVVVVNGELSEYKLGPMAPLIAIYSIFYMMLAFTNIIVKVKSNEIPLVRVKYILIGLIFVSIGALLNLFPEVGKYPFDIVLNTINGLLIAYSIYKYRFLEIKLIVKKGMAYSLYTLMLSGIYIMAIFAVQQILKQILGYENLTLTYIIAVILALVFQPIKNVIQHWIDRLFYRENLDHKIILKDFSRIINNVLDLDELTNSLVEAINRGLQPKKVSIILKLENDSYSTYNSSYKHKWTKEIHFSNDHPIIQWFKQGNDILTMTEIESLPFFTGLWSMEKRQLLDIETKLMLPIKFREQLIGILILSEKKGSESYSQNEVDLLYTLVNNAGVVIENAKMYEDAKLKSITDGLTKLYNHRYFHEILGEIINEKRYEAFSIAMIDVDLFKIYNDLYGHSAGDRALIRIAEVLRETTRDEDIVVRYGGEEFAIIFPNIEGMNSLKAIERIRRAVETSFYSSENYDELITISAGVASYPQDGNQGQVVLDNADKAMYVAKQTGRNKTILFSHKDEEYGDTNSHNEVKKMQNSIQSAYLSAIYALAAAIDAKDHYTFGHSENVSNLAVQLAKSVNFSEEKLNIIRSAGLLHDIGKIGIPESILTKTDILTKEEFNIMKKHVDLSIPIIKHVPNLINLIPAIMSHHERYDGNGYPRGIKGENIPIEGRCLSIVDAFDAMITDRPYRKALTVEEAIGELRRCSGTQFDPILTDKFINLIEEGKIEEINMVNRSTKVTA